MCTLHSKVTGPIAVVTLSCTFPGKLGLSLDNRERVHVERWWREKDSLLNDHRGTSARAPKEREKGREGERAKERDTQRKRDRDRGVPRESERETRKQTPIMQPV